MNDNPLCIQISKSINKIKVSNIESSDRISHQSIFLFYYWEYKYYATKCFCRSLFIILAFFCKHDEKLRGILIQDNLGNIYILYGPKNVRNIENLPMIVVKYLKTPA